MNDLISRQAAIDALWKALYAYEDKTEKQFIESEDLKIEDWMLHRIFVQNMSGIDIKTILDLPSVKPKKGEWIPMGEIDADGNQYYNCSNCQCGETHSPKVEVCYCWNCGADMRGDGNETN